MKAAGFNFVAKVLNTMPVKKRRKTLREMKRTRDFCELHGLNVYPYVAFTKITGVLKNHKTALGKLNKIRYQANSIKDKNRKADIIEKLDNLITLISNEI
jgi:hypothetical protein